MFEQHPGQARAALSTIENASRQVLTEMRSLVGALHPAAGAPSDWARPLGPAPGLADLADLVVSARQAGVDIDLRQRGLPDDPPPGVALTAYRIVQEALTNVLRHAGPTRCEVTVDHLPGVLTVEVANSAPGSGHTAARTGGGRGLAGMRERVALYDGELTAGRTAAGGYRVAARLPFSPATP